jgi:hypothetical protein
LVADTAHIYVQVSSAICYDRTASAIYHYESGVAGHTRGSLLLGTVGNGCIALAVIQDETGSAGDADRARIRCAVGCDVVVDALHLQQVPAVGTEVTPAASIKVDALGRSGYASAVEDAVV